MNTLPPITPEKLNEIQQKLEDFPEISKYYGEWLNKALKETDPRAYPIIKQFLTKNYKYLEQLDKVLGETSVVKGFPTIVKHSKNKMEFYDEFSILKLGRILKNIGYAFEFIPPSEEPKPDVKAKIWDRDVFFEVKHLRNVDEAENLLFDFFNEYPSRFLISIKLDDAVTLSQVLECIQILKTVMETKKDEEFPQRLSLGYADAELRLSKPHPKTPVIVGPSVELIPFKRTKIKIETTFHEALEQLKSTPSTSPNFVVYDIDNWRIESEDMGRAFYGDGITDVTLATLELQKTLCILKKETKHKVHDQKITKAFKRNFFDVLKDNWLIPQFSYSSQNGLFFLDESEEINGVIAFRGDKQTLFPNPFVKDDKLIAYHQLVKMLST